MNKELEDTYGSYEVAELVGVTYRQLDYWIRTGIIKIEHGANGSGTNRRFTHSEVAKLKALVATYSEACGIMEAFSTGQLWAGLDEVCQPD